MEHWWIDTLEQDDDEGEEAYDEDRAWRDQNHIWSRITRNIFYQLEDAPESLKHRFAPIMPQAEKYLLSTEPVWYRFDVDDVLTKIDEILSDIIDADPVLKWVIQTRDLLQDAKEEGIY